MNRFPVTNNGLVRADYEWNVSCAATDGDNGASPPALNPFAISPEAGFINPGQTQTFKLRFAPLEIHQYRATLLARYEYTVHVL